MRIRGKVRTKAEWQSLIIKCDSSEQSQKEFCLAEGLSLTTFYKWRKRLKNPSQERFVEVVPNERTALELPGAIELVLPHGIVLRVKG